MEKHSVQSMSPRRTPERVKKQDIMVVHASHTKSSHLLSSSSCPVQSIPAHSRNTITHVVIFSSLSHLDCYLPTLKDASLPRSLITPSHGLVISLSSSVVKDTVYTFCQMLPDCYIEMWHLSSSFPRKKHVCIEFRTCPLPFLLMYLLLSYSIHCMF